jgi:predicted extracellular nuclease
MIAGFILLQPVTLMAQRGRASKIAEPISRGAIQPANPDTGSGAVALNTLGVAATENLNTLSNTAGSTTNTTLPNGWYITEGGGGARDNEQYAVDTGGSNTGDTYSYGAAASTERALGELRSGTLIPLFGAKFTNNTGATITSLNVSYTGEQWRFGGAHTTVADRLDFQYSLDATDLSTGTYLDANALDFNPPVTAGTAGALDGNAAANRTAISSTVIGLSIPNGASFFIRFNDVDATGADDGLAVDDFSITPQAGAVTPTLNINDVTQAEGDAGTTNFSFTVSLSAAAGGGGVTFDIATADGTATTANSDYVGKSLTGQSIPAGSSNYQFVVVVNGDTTPETNETFFVNVTNITGASGGDTQGQGTITNDDVTLTPIHNIQGSGSTSPLAGTSVTTRGIVTGIKSGSSGGFFIQEPDASVDADPNTSEGIFIFTGASVPAAAIVGNYVQVGGTVQEFVFSSDPNSPPITEISGTITASVLTTGNTLPLPHTLTGAETIAPSGTTNPLDSLEEFEGMRVTVPSLTVVAPTDGTINEPNATVSGNDVFYGVVTGVARPFREAGVNVSDATAMGLAPTIPRFDENPERIRVDSDGQPGTAAVDVPAGTVLTNVTGPLDYSFRAYTILPDTTIILPGLLPGSVPVPTPTANEVTVASFNMERFFDDQNDPSIGEPVLTNAAYNKRLDKASQIIRNVQRTPDVIGVEEMENLIVLQGVANKVNTDFGNLALVNYQAYLVEGNDIGGIDVGFLVNSARIGVVDVTQFGKTDTFTNPDSSTAILNDRPPLVLRATAPRPGGGTFAFTVIVNHLRSLTGIDDTTAGSNGWATEGDRVRAKRKAQAEYLANLIQARQTADPTERIITVGDMNAFQVNDGYVDVINTIKGTPVPDNQTLVPGDGADLVNPNLTDMVDTLSLDQRYSYSFDGNAQVLDHIIVNQPALAVTNRFAYARDDADFPVKNYELANELRLSDHDQPVIYLSLTSTGVLPSAGSVIISEFRFRGAGGPSDEFVELYNNTDSPVTVSTTDGSAGWAVVTADGVTRFVVPNGTVMPARGHYLGTNSSGYTLDAYATGDVTFTTDIPDNSGVALFRSANLTNFTLSERLDAAGYSGVNVLYREGVGFPTGGGETTFNIDYTFFRSMARTNGGLPKDTGDNLSDFMLISTTGSLTGMGANLGAPGPENLASPINRNSQFGVTLLNPSASSSSAPNRTRDFIPVANGTNGTMEIRRTFTNNTGAPVTRLRFRIVDVTTFVYPPVSGQADLRALDATPDPIVVIVNGNPVDVHATTVEQPPTQINGGGWNSSMNVGFVNLRAPLASGGSVSVRFRLGVMTTGNFRFLVNIEALP